MTAKHTRHLASRGWIAVAVGIAKDDDDEVILMKNYDGEDGGWGRWWWWWGEKNVCCQAGFIASSSLAWMDWVVGWVMTQEQERESGGFGCGRRTMDGPPHAGLLAPRMDVLAE